LKRNNIKSYILYVNIAVVVVAAVTVVVVAVVAAVTVVVAVVVVTQHGIKNTNCSLQSFLRYSM
jgi:hypothetical protein